jgi:hypothetical protein
MGDLNYRIDLNAAAEKSVPPSPAPYADEAAHHAAVSAMIAAKDWAGLAAADQLLNARANGEAFFEFDEGTMAFEPTFKVQRQGGTHYKDQRIPSFCDRVLWKSMPHLIGRVNQTSLRSLPGVSTSDHKPVVATFNVAPSPWDLAPRPDVAGTPRGTPRSGTPRTRGFAMASSKKQLKRVDRATLPLVRVTSLTISELISADITGGSDPYLIFFTNPPDLLGPVKEAPISAIKKAGRRSATPSQARLLRSNTTPLEQDASAPPAVEAAEVELEPAASTPTRGSRLTLSSRPFTGPTKWDDRDLPLLRPRCLAEQLANVSLIIAVVDHDDLSADDYLGVFTMPLAPNDYDPAAATVPEEYTVSFDGPLSCGNATKGIGNIRGSITISSGACLEAALEKAKQDEAGTAARRLREKSNCSCEVM